jgi:hypothetical protein
LFVGIDVSKRRLDIHSRPSGESFTIDYDEASVAALIERLVALAPALIVLEATGGMEVRLAAALAAAGLPVAIVTWPSTNGAEATWLIPENLSSVPDVTTLVKNASTPGLFDRLEAATQPVHLLPFDDPDAGGPLDRMTTSFAAEIVRRDKPALLLMHLLDLDHREHVAGPRSPAACRSLDQIDALVGEIVDAYRSAALFDQTAFFIVSDHGFLPAHTQINLTALIADAGIETRLGGGSAALYGTDDRLEAVRARVAPKYRDQLRWIGRADARAFGGFPDAGAVLCAKTGYRFTAPGGTDIMSPSGANTLGMHGHCPDEPGIDASFIASGAGIRRTGAIPRVRMIDVGPTIAAALGLTLLDAEGRPIKEVLRR